MTKRRWSRTAGTFVRLSRPQFLLGGAIMFALGSSAAESMSLGRYMLGQALVTSAQITAHYFNEYADRDVDQTVVNRTFFSGGSGVLVSQEFAPIVAYRAGWASATLAALLAAIIAPFAPVASLLGLIAIGVSWTYSMPPTRLLETGWGELVTALTVAGLVPLVGVLVQGSLPTRTLWSAIAILVPVQYATILVFEIPDIASDQAFGKRGVAVRIGTGRTIVLVVSLLLASAAALVSLVAIGEIHRWSLSAVLTAIPAYLAIWGVRTERFGLGTSAAVAMLVTTALGLIIGLSR